MAVPGTSTGTRGWSALASAAVAQYTKTPIANAKVRHTNGSPRNSRSRGVKLVADHCTTPKSSE